MSAWEDVLLDSGDQRQPAEWWWAYVTDTNPLRIRRELETHPIGSTPSTLIAGLEVGDKVRVVNYLGQAVIVGRAGGPMLPADRITGVLSPAQLPDIPEISDGTNYLRVGDDGAPCLWSDPVLVHGRDYDNAGPGADRNRVMVVTQFGTLGTLSGALDRDYIPYRFAGGRITLATPTSGQVVNTTVTFPSGTFTSAPTVAWVTADTTVPGNPVTGVSVSSVTQTSMRIYLRRTSTANTGIYWGAAQL